MTRSLLQRLRADRRGVGAMEFALATPAFVLLVVGAVQLGALACARTGMQHAVNEGVRYATLYPTPTDAQIVTRVSQRAFGMSAANMTGPTVTHGVQDGVAYTDISIGYVQPMNFIFFQGPSMTLSYSQRAF